MATSASTVLLAIMVGLSDSAQVKTVLDSYYIMLRAQAMGWGGVLRLNASDPSEEIGAGLPSDPGEK